MLVALIISNISPQCNFEILYSASLSDKCTRVAFDEWQYFTEASEVRFFTNTVGGARQCGQSSTDLQLLASLAICDLIQIRIKKSIYLLL